MFDDVVKVSSEAEIVSECKPFDSEQSSEVVKLFTDWVLELLESDRFSSLYSQFYSPHSPSFYSLCVSITYDSNGVHDLSFQLGSLARRKTVKLDFPYLRILGSDYFLTNDPNAERYQGLLYCPFYDLLSRCFK